MREPMDALEAINAAFKERDRKARHYDVLRDALKDLVANAEHFARSGVYLVGVGLIEQARVVLAATEEPRND